MLNYRIESDEKGNMVAYLITDDGELPFNPIKKFDKDDRYNKGLYVIDKNWTKRTDAVFDKLKKKIRARYDNVIVLNFAKEKEINTDSQVVEYVYKHRKKDYSDPEVVKSMTIERTKGFASSIMASYEKCYVFLENIEKMDDFNAEMFAKLIDWNCVVFVDALPGL